MSKTVIVDIVDDNFYATPLLDWLYNKGFKMYDKNAGVTKNAYMPLRNDLVFIFSEDEKSIDEMTVFLAGAKINLSIYFVKNSSPDEILGTYNETLHRKLPDIKREIVRDMFQTFEVKHYRTGKPS